MRAFASDLLVAAGMTPARADVVARILVEGDLMGHTTHGLQLMGPYLKSIAKNEMLLDGEPEIIASRPVTELWDGKNLPGPWLVENGFAAPPWLLSSEPVPLLSDAATILAVWPPICGR